MLCHMLTHTLRVLFHSSRRHYFLLYDSVSFCMLSLMFTYYSWDTQPFKSHLPKVVQQVPLLLITLKITTDSSHSFLNKDEQHMLFLSLQLEACLKISLQIEFIVLCRGGYVWQRGIMVLLCLDKGPKTRVAKLPWNISIILALCVHWTLRLCVRPKASSGFKLTINTALKL